MAPAISVVIPSYNRSALLKRAIDSVLTQTVRPREIIVVDDGSTDNTRELCASYGNQIEYIWQKNAGAAVARNAGVIRSHSPWIAFLDSDDYWTPFHLATMTKAIEQTEGEAAFYFSDMQMGECDGCTSLWKLANFAPPKSIHLTNDGTSWTFLRWQPMVLQASVLRRDVWIGEGGLDPRFRLKHDTDLFFRLSIGRKVCAVSGMGCIYGDDVSDIRLTTTLDPSKVTYWEESILLLRGVLRRFPNLSPRYKRVARWNLVAAHCALFRIYWSSRNVKKSVYHLLMLALADPRCAFLLVIRRADANSPVILPEYA
jgi:glycosyltransferase involved in cell wall biosynthesis